MKREVSAAAPHSKRAGKSPQENATRSVRSVVAAADDDALALQLLHLPWWWVTEEADAVSRDGFGGGTVGTVEVVGKGGGGGGAGEEYFVYSSTGVMHTPAVACGRTTGS